MTIILSTAISPSDEVTNMNDRKIMEVSNLTKFFEIKSGAFGTKALLHAVEDVTFDLYEGETLGIVGESGSGKSTLGRVLLRLLKHTSGSVRYEGKEILTMSNAEFAKIRKDLQMIFQDPYACLNPKLKIGSAISEPLLSNKLVSSKKEARERTMELLSLVGLKPEMYNRYPHEFSGGQSQRISIARAIALEPRILVCDEAVSALDVSVQAQILNLFTELKQHLNLTYIFIGHDLSVIKYVSDRVLVMYLGEIMELAPTERIFQNTCHPYTKALISAIPDPDLDNQTQRILLTGDITNPIDPPDCCRFASRCFCSKEICHQVHPPLREVEDGHFVRCHLFDQIPTEGV